MSVSLEYLELCSAQTGYAIGPLAKGRPPRGNSCRYCKAHRIQKSADAFAGRKIYLTYRSVTGKNDRIEVDLNFLFRLPIAGTATQEMWQPGELERPTVRIVSFQKILVGKLLAYLDRSSARDVWDLAYTPA